MTHRDPDLTHPETIGDLADRLPDDEWVDLPEFGIRVKKWADPPARTPATGLSTSAQLRDTQRALAASQQDLSRCEEVRDQLREARDSAWHAHDLTLAELTTAIQELAQLRVEYAQARDYLDREHERRPWQVARQDAGHRCASCSGPIVRGQAFQPLADSNELAHCHCPDPKES